MEAYISQIMLWPATFAPRQWAYCDGGLMPIVGNEALFSLIGTIYGGDGRTTFGRPDLRGRVPIGAGRGPGLSNYQEGQMAGTETVTLTQLEMPQHNHVASTSGGGQATLRAYNNLANQDNPGPNHVLAQANFPASLGETRVKAYSNQTPDTTVGGVTGGGGSVTIQNAGGSQPHYNMQPFQVMNYVIALYGIFPPRS